MGYAYEAAHHEAEDGAEERRPGVDGDRGSSLRVVSGVASAGCVVGNVGGRYSVLRGVRAVDVHGYIHSGGDGSGSLLSRPRPLFSPLFTEVPRREILRTSALRSPEKFSILRARESTSSLLEFVLLDTYCSSAHNRQIVTQRG